MTHCRLSREKWRSFAIDGSATFTIETSRIVMKNAVATTARMRQRCGFDGIRRPYRKVGVWPRRVRPRPAFSSDLPQLAPLGVDGADLTVGGVHRLRRGHLLLCDLREHLRNHELAEHLAERRVGVAGISRVRRVLLRDRREDAVLAD